MNDSAKKAVLIGAIAIFVFWILKPKGSSISDKKAVEREKIPELVISDEDHNSSEAVQDAVVVMKAYIAAWNNNESDSFLESLNKDTLAQYGMQSYWKGAKLAVKDKQGNDILINK